MVKKIIVALFVLCLIMGIIRWQNAGTGGGPVAALEWVMNGVANFFAVGIPALIGWIQKMLS